MTINEWMEKHPELFAEHNAGFGCGKGWFKLVGSILGYVVNDQKTYMKLNEHCDRKTYAQSDVPFYHFKVEQIKEKYGGLRFYYHTENVEHDWEKFDREWYYTRLQEKLNYLQGYTSAMEIVSEFTCQETGDRGIKTKTGWIKTLHPGLAEISTMSFKIQKAQAKFKALSEEQDKIFTALREELNLAEDTYLSDWLFDTVYNDGDIAKFEEKYKKGY